MSQESQQWLNENTLTGYGYRPWHFNPGVSTEPYEGSVPEEAVSNLFPTIGRRELMWSHPGDLTTGKVEDHVVLVDTRNEAQLGIVSAQYAVHQYHDSIGNLGLPVASAGILRGGSYGWIQYGGPDTVLSRHNITTETKLLAVTGCDGGHATQFRYVTTLAVCDNTLAVAVLEGGDLATKIRHTQNSAKRVEAAREAYGLLDKVSAIATAQLDAAAEVHVTDAQIAKFLDALLHPGEDAAQVGLTRYEHRKADVAKWLNGPWGDYRNSKLGVLQAVDSAARWDWPTRKKTEAQRTSEWTVSGEFDSRYTTRRDVLESILEGAS
jgi:hypothetical protein